MTLNFDQARHNMVEQQIRPWEVFSPDILKVFETVPREDFVPNVFRKLAFADMAIPLGEGQHMANPVIEGRMLQALDIKPGDEVLEIGTGSGFITACLRALGGRVTSLELFPSLLEEARINLRQAGVDDVETHAVDALNDWQDDRQFDVIVFTGSMPQLPLFWKQKLKLGGRCFVVLGDKPSMQASLITRLDSAEWRQQTLFETELPPLLQCPSGTCFKI